MATNRLAAFQSRFHNYSLDKKAINQDKKVEMKLLIVGRKVTSLVNLEKVMVVKRA